MEEMLIILKCNGMKKLCIHMLLQLTRIADFIENIMKILRTKAWKVNNMDSIQSIDSHMREVELRKLHNCTLS